MIGLGAENHLSASGLYEPEADMIGEVRLVSDLTHTTVDAEFRAGDEAGLVAQEEQRGGSDLVGGGGVPLKPARWTMAASSEVAWICCLPVGLGGVENRLAGFRRSHRKGVIGPANGSGRPPIGGPSTRHVQPLRNAGPKTDVPAQRGRGAKSDPARGYTSPFTKM